MTTVATDWRDAPVARLADMDACYREGIIASLTTAQRRELNARWAEWAHDGQQAPPGDWHVWLIMAGRGFGKTRAGAEWVSAVADAHPGARIALIGGTRADVERVMVEGESGILAIGRQRQKVTWHRTTGTVAFDNGAKAFCYAAEAPDMLRGPEHQFAWCDELAKWRRAQATWDNLMMGLRLGERPRVLVTTTPRPVALLKRIRALAGLIEVAGRTAQNPHLPAHFVEAMLAQYGGTALGRQELDGELIDDIAGALWTRAAIERCRIDAPPPVSRVVVGVDPPAGTADGSAGDACGIIAVALGEDGRGYVLEDASVAGASPEGWAREVAACAARHQADRVVAEANQGGQMVQSVLLAADMALPVRLVRATRGKVARAEPVATLYEHGRVSHAGRFPALEDEMCGLVPGGGYHGPGRSPDRADALVWALTELMLGRGGKPGVRAV